MGRLLDGCLSVLLFAALASPAIAQGDIKWKGQDDYNGYMAVWNEKTDFPKQAAAAEKFLTDFKDADPKAREDVYVRMVWAYAQAGNWARTLESVEKMSQLGANLDAPTRMPLLLFGMQAGIDLKNNVKTQEYAEKVLVVDPNEVNSIFTLSGLLSNNLPADEGAKQAQMNRVLEMDKRALAQVAPAGFTPAAWAEVRLQLRKTSCFLLLNMKKYPETIAECQEALKLNKKDGASYYWIGLAMHPELVAKVKKYQDAVNKLNENRTADQITRDDLKAAVDAAELVATRKKDEIIEIFAKSVAAGGEAATQAREQLLSLHKGSADEITKLINDAKVALGS